MLYKNSRLKFYLNTLELLEFQVVAASTFTRVNASTYVATFQRSAITLQSSNAHLFSFPSRPKVLLPTGSLSHSPIAHWLSVPLSHCPSVPLPICPTALLCIWLFSPVSVLFPTKEIGCTASHVRSVGCTFTVCSKCRAKETGVLWISAHIWSRDSSPSTQATTYSVY